MLIATVWKIHVCQNFTHLDSRLFICFWAWCEVVLRTMTFGNTRQMEMKFHMVIFGPQRQNTWYLWLWWPPDLSTCAIIRSKQEISKSNRQTGMTFTMHIDRWFPEDCTQDVSFSNGLVAMTFGEILNGPKRINWFVSNDPTVNKHYTFSPNTGKGE